MKLLHDVTVISTVQQAHARRAQSKTLSRADRSSRDSALLERRRTRIAKACARNATELPRLASTLSEFRGGVLSGGSEQWRWVVLDPAAITLSLWERPPAGEPDSEALRLFPGSSPWGAFSSIGAIFGSRAPRKVFSLYMLEEVDSNASFRNIFIRFTSGDSLCLTAPSEEDFRCWLKALESYDAPPLEDEDEEIAPSFRCMGPKSSNPATRMSSRTPSPPCYAATTRAEAFPSRLSLARKDLPEPCL
mmetsp:Transcript_61223/g.124836  ORF Transcript_61223/g.124836 Transcript_61223/m.124836 type:complete len:248 (-) Transcript_61223:134-877(-)